ncbi:hypothetical protein M413DRAFT_368987 [Hebeloma cylindrosporum]|uniref:Alpha-ketoglutarate-dependent dioxygenase AlkB-like domain-containing protein n=1 Tax=Hebeloma cylindrosporum TaxID=76867 RepID=A0A0C2XB46_HEBCY|nr:hypothetical protein M413DRAFT_368987 [Hebeloma cylindrosporum h7]
MPCAQAILVPTACHPCSPQLKRKRSISREPLEILPSDTPIYTLAPSYQRKKPKILRIEIPTGLNSGLEDVHENEGSSSHSLFSASDNDSLFDGLDNLDEDSFATELNVNSDHFLAYKTAPPIPGLFFDPSVLIPQELADSVVAFCMKTYFRSAADNQVMLFGRFSPSDSSKSTSGLPPILSSLLKELSSLLQSVLPPKTYSLLFPLKPTAARQAIINLYQPGEGISPHVDLLKRYGDGIIGVSFSSPCVMRFDKVDPVTADGSDNRWDVFLPERSVLSSRRRQGTDGLMESIKGGETLSRNRPILRVGSNAAFV